MKTLDFYQYETKRVCILWHNKVQPLGMFKSAKEAINHLTNSFGTTKDYSLNCDGTIIKL